jgi:hypothetical protein
VSRSSKYQMRGAMVNEYLVRVAVESGPGLIPATGSPHHGKAVRSLLGG